MVNMVNKNKVTNKREENIKQARQSTYKRRAQESKLWITSLKQN